MIHTSDGESFEDEVGHVFDHNLMREGNEPAMIDHVDTKMIGKNADLEVEPSFSTDFKDEVERKRNAQESHDAMFDMFKKDQDRAGKETMGLGPTQFDDILKDWGSYPLSDETNQTPGINSKTGDYQTNYIAMEPFDPSSLAPLGVPHKIGGEGGGGGNVVPMRNPANQNNKEWTLIRNKTKGTVALENRKFEDIVKDMGATLEEGGIVPRNIPEKPLSAYENVSPPMSAKEIDWKTRDRLGRTRARVDWSLERKEMPNALDLKMLKRYQNTHPEYMKGLEDLKDITSISKDVNPRGFFHGTKDIEKFGGDRMFDLENILPLVPKPK